MAEPRMRSGAAKTMFVACKQIGGLILNVCKMKEVTTASPLGPRSETWGVKVGEIHLKGPRTANGLNPNTDFSYIVNAGIDADLWDQWYDHNREMPLVVNGMVLAATNLPDLEAMIRERRDTLCGMEPLLQSNDSRVPRAVTQEDEQRRRLAAG